jgi:transposase
MNDPIFNQPGAIITAVTETSNQVAFHITVEAESCPHCGSASRVGHGKIALSRPIADTHARGKQAKIYVTRKRFKCGGCARTYMGEMQHVDMELGMTSRLVDYIMCEAPKSPIAAIARSVGVTPDKVSAVVANLISLLNANHTIATPRAIGIDDLRLRRKLYTVITNGQNGHAIAILPSGKATDIADWIIEHLDRRRVQFVVSDLAAVNIAVIEKAWPAHPRSPHHLPGGHRPIHVADKFHVLKAAHEALTGVVSKELDRLRKGGGATAGAAATLERLRPFLLKGVPKIAPPLCGLSQPAAQLEFPFVKDPRDAAAIRIEINCFLASHEVISRAFWATMRLHRLYNAPSLAMAKHHAVSFRRQCESHLIAKAFEAALNQFIRHEERIFNFFKASSLDANGKRVGLTNNPTERRNGNIRRAWRSSRGIRNHDYLRLRAVYEPIDMRALLAAI